MAAPVTFTNSLVPMVVLLALTVALPMILAGSTLSQMRLGLAMVATGLIVWAAGAVLMALLYARLNNGETGGIAANLGHSAVLGLLWGPVLLLVWLMRAQGVERRRGLSMKDRP